MIPLLLWLVVGGFFTWLAFAVEPEAVTWKERLMIYAIWFFGWPLTLLACWNWNEIGKYEKGDSD